MDFLHGLRVVEPANEQEVSAALLCANRDGLAVIPRGGGTKLDWGNPPARAGLILSTARLNRIIEHAWADLTVTVEAGCTVADLQHALAIRGQRLALDALWPERATVGGILSVNDSGALRLTYGGLRDLIIGITLVLADGTIARSGGKVVKNVAGYDLPKLATGALGTLGVITQAIFRLHPLPRNTRTLTLDCADIDSAQALLLTLQGSNVAHTALQVRLGGSMAPKMDILLEGTDAGMEAQEARIRGLARVTLIEKGDTSIWRAREELTAGGAFSKLSVLPANIATTVSAIERTGDPEWYAVFYANGIGWLSLNAPLNELRVEVEAGGGSLFVLRRSPAQARMDTWGETGDALPLMRAIKSQFDPNGTLNPGRFAGGI
ncbi:MAG: FAD-binding oxidoreductase [Acidobacteriia bacterium]|nr:FAD-binding oxidoreductase [Terriglobia bacterium]